MRRYDLVVIGAGPAGLSAAIEAASHGAEVLVCDENARPGGQLFKQIHKFFGSKEHRAKTRGFKIGEMLLKEAEALGVKVILNATVMGIFPNKEVSVMLGNHVEHIKANSIVIATGASENMLTFHGWTLPGVIGAGAAQTMMNLHGVMPGKNILMVGSGNVGLVVGYQLLQAGCNLAAIIDASPHVGGYGVHAAKVARTGVAIYTSHTIVKAYGDGKVEGAVIAEVDGNWKPIPGSEKDLKIDTICLAVGLTPMSQLAKMAGCEMLDTAAKGGLTPVIDENNETSVSGIYAAGDVAGIEEASSAMINGRIAGASMAYRSGYMSEEKYKSTILELKKSISKLHEGMFAPQNKGKTLEKTDEGFDISLNLLKTGYLEDSEIESYPGVPKAEKRVIGITPIIECTQNIPCNPCQTVCPKGCITVGSTITKLPSISENANCSGCAMCVAACPGQAIFLVDESEEGDFATVSIPYEFIPLPKAGQKGLALERSGTELGEAEVVSVSSAKALDETAVVKLRVPKQWSMKARFFKPL